MKVYEFEGKNKEELILKALKELNVKEDEMFINEEEETTGLLKKKKYKLRIALKSDVLEFSKEYINKLVKLMGIDDLMLETKRTDNYLKIIMHSKNSSILIGKNGRTLSSLQTILKAVLNNKLNMNINIILDVDNYKVKREKNIEYLAKKLAREVVKTNEPIKMDSMNSYERRIVHNILSDFKGVNTQSEGEEPNRKVVIYPNK